MASLTAVRLASFTTAGRADHCTCPRAICPLGETSLTAKGSTTEETCGIALTFARADSIAA